MTNLEINRNVLEINNQIADRNRKIFAENEIYVINILGSPGAGKTSLLEKIMSQLVQHVKVGVIEGDLATANDAKRIAKHDVPVIQINTNGGCHLDAAMVNKVLSGFSLRDLDLLIIENVGNLVCPADFDLGENIKGVVLSVTEGEDKPEKYPNTFINAAFTVINKTDLLPYCDINMDHMLESITKINSVNQIFQTSCRNTQGMNEFVNWLLTRVKLSQSK